MSAATVFGILGMVALIGSLGQFSPAGQPVWSTSRITSDEGLELWPAIDSEGSKVVYSRRMPEKGFDLYVQKLESGSPVRLTDSPGNDVHAKWSPDASAILFARIERGSCQIMLVQVGGEERVVRECVPGSWPSFAWSDQGSLVAIADLGASDDGAQEYELTIYDSDTFERTAGPFGEANVNYRRPVFVSADEVAFVAYEEGYTGSIRLLDVGTSQMETLFPFTGPINGLAYQSRDGTLIVAGERNGEQDIYRTDFQGNGSWQRINATAPSSDRSGDHVVYAQWRGNANIYTVDLAEHYTVRKYDEVIASTQIDRSPRWSNRMDRIGFVSSRSGEEWLWVAGFNGDSPVRINGSGLGRVEDFDWSPDDSHIVLVGVRGGRRELLILPTDDDNEDADHEGWDSQDSAVIVDSNLDPQYPSWSADGSQVFFLGGTGDDRTVMRIAASGGVPEAVGLPGSSGTIQSTDGTLYFTRTDSSGIWTMDGRESRQVLDDNFDRYNWALSGAKSGALEGALPGKAIFYLSAVEGESSELLIKSYDPETGESRVHDQIQSQLAPGRAFDISPGGTHVLLAVLQHSDSDIIMLSAAE